MRRQLLSAAGSALAAADLGVGAPLLQELANTLSEDLKAQVGFIDCVDFGKLSKLALCNCKKILAIPHHVWRIHPDQWARTLPNGIRGMAIGAKADEKRHGWTT